MSIKIHTEVDVMIWEYHASVTNSTPIAPRFLGYGFYEDADGLIEPWKSPGWPTTVIGRPAWTAHLITVSNAPTETRTRYYNCLTTPPVISESLPSLTSAMTDFSAISIDMADPDIRQFFAIDMSQVTTQNFVSVFRVICEKRYLVWRGYVDGVSFGADYGTTLSCRPITKRFDRQATFGFLEKISQWKTNEYRIPIVAARLIPYTAQVSEHSAVGCEPYNTNYSYLQPAQPTIYQGNGVLSGYSDTSASDTFGSQLIVNPDYTRQLMSASQMHAWSVELDTDSGVNNPLVNILYPIYGDNRVNANRPTPAENRADNHIENYRAHMEHKRPQYVSFDRSSLVPTRIDIYGDGRMSFARGIFFTDSEADDVSGDFDPSIGNYEPSVGLRHDALDADNNPTSVVGASHLDRFLIGAEWFMMPRPFVDRGNLLISRATNTRWNEVYPLASYSAMYVHSGGGELREGIRKPRYALRWKGFDQTAFFPSTNLGDSYANWTLTPVATGGRFTHRYALDAGPDSYEFFRPQLDERRHPLDSFFRWTLGSDKSSVAAQDAYFRASVYTPHAVGLTYQHLGNFSGVSTSEVENLMHDDGWMPLYTASKYLYVINFSISVYERDLFKRPYTDDHYSFVQWNTFTTMQGGPFGKGLHEVEARNYYKIYEVTFLDSQKASSIANRDHLRQGVDPSLSAAANTWLANGHDAVPMARCKDMYITTPDIDRHLDIDPAKLATISGGLVDVETRNQGAVNNLRVMPAIPRTPLPAVEHDYPYIETERSPYGGGAYYVSATYGLLDEVGYWDSSILNNASAQTGFRASEYFKSYYHHDQSGIGQGVAPANFIRAVVQAAGFKTNIDFTSSTYVELTDENPMQLISDTDTTYRSLMDRLLPALGKFLRFDPRQNQMVLTDWSRGAAQDPYDAMGPRNIVAYFDSGCMIYRGTRHVAASRATSFIFENRDMLEGTNTLENFSTDDFRLAKYSVFEATVFAQGRTVVIPHGTWWESATDGLRFFDVLGSVLASRIDIISFAVPTEVLLGVGELGLISVGSWVRIKNEGIVGGIADVMITETSQGEALTEFSGYRFSRVGINDPDDNTLSLPAMPEESSLPDESEFQTPEYESEDREHGTVLYEIGDIKSHFTYSTPIVGVSIDSDRIIPGEDFVFSLTTQGGATGPVSVDTEVTYRITMGGSILADSDVRTVTTVDGVTTTDYDQTATIAKGQSSVTITLTTQGRSSLSADYYYISVRIVPGKRYRIFAESAVARIDDALPGLLIDRYNVANYDVDKITGIAVDTDDSVFAIESDGAAALFSSYGQRISAPFSIPNGADGAAIYGDVLYILRENSIRTYSVITGARITTSADFDTNVSLANANDHPRGIAVNGSRIYVADDNDEKVYVYNRISGARESSDEFDLNSDNGSPTGMSITDSMDTASNRIYIADADSSVYVYTVAGTYVASEKITPKYAGSVSADIGRYKLDAGNDGGRGIGVTDTRIYIADRTDKKVYVYNALTGAREASEDFNLHSSNRVPQGLAVTSNRIYVIDSNFDDLLDINPKVFVYDLAGNRQRSEEFDLLQIDDNPYRGIAVANNRIYVVLENSNTISAYTISGRRRKSDDVSISSGGSWQGLSITSNRIYLASKTTNSIFVYSLSGSLQRSELVSGIPDNVSGIDVTNDKIYLLVTGKLEATDPDKGVYVYALDGTPLFGSDLNIQPTAIHADQQKKVIYIAESDAFSTYTL